MTTVNDIIESLSDVQYLSAKRLRAKGTPWIDIADRFSIEVNKFVQLFNEKTTQEKK